MFTAYDDSPSSSSSDDEACTTTPLTAKKAPPSITGDGPRTEQSPPPPSRIVMHLDVDAFYCQCEELRDGSLNTKPFSVGQKHIIVTCNYVARSVGVTKLMLRTTAKKVCPDLVIIEGSDLQPYRRQSRKIYNAFRKAVAGLPGSKKNLARKGGMDEMFADITFAVDTVAGTANGGVGGNVDVFIYGDDPSAHVSISEDQSGATAVASTRAGASHMPQAEKDMERSRLHIAAKFAAIIRAAVKDDTGFTACAGVSTSPMLAKLASELRKPDSLNLLYSWRSSSIVEVMPLRKVPGLGSRTLRSLTDLLEILQNMAYRDLEQSAIAAKYGCKVERLFGQNARSRRKWSALLQGESMGLYETKEEAIKRTVCAALVMNDTNHVSGAGLHDPLARASSKKRSAISGSGGSSKRTKSVRDRGDRDRGDRDVFEEEPSTVPEEFPVGRLNSATAMDDSTLVTLRQPPRGAFHGDCVACQTNKADLVFEPCQHNVLCSECNKKGICMVSYLPDSDYEKNSTVLGSRGSASGLFRLFLHVRELRE